MSLFFGYSSFKLSVDPNVESLIPENTEIRQLMAKYQQEGVSGEYLVLAVESDSPFDIDKLSVLHRVLNELEGLPELEPGITPFNLMTFEKQGSRLTVVPIAPEQQAPRTNEELSLFKQRLLGSPHAENLVVSAESIRG